jgi:hypothetical protein
VAETLAERLHTGLAIDPDPEDAPPMAFGQFVLADNPGFLMGLANQTAQATGAIPDFHAFQKLFQSRPDKPVEPDPDDPAFLPSPEKPYPPDLIAQYGLQKIRQVDAAKAYNTALKTYHERYRHYKEIQTRSRAVTQAYNPSPERYLDFVRDTVSASDPAFAQSFFWPQGRCQFLRTVAAPIRF